MPVQETSPSRGVIRFNAYEVDVRAGELRKHGIRLKLQDQPFRVLQILLDHPGDVVSRDELQKQIWPSDTFVDFDHGLNNAIRRLRDALGDTAETPRFIETLPKRGYRFIATVERRNGDSQAALTAQGTASQAVPAPGNSRRRFRAAIFAVLGLAFVGASMFGLDVGGWRSRIPLKFHPPAIQSLAVLPLQNLSGDAAQDYFADAMTDSLITDISQISSLKVISRTSVMRYKKTDKQLPEIARELNVDGIVEGAIQRSGDRVRITAQLIYGPSDKHVWANSYERDVRDVFALERDVSQDISQQVQVRVAAPQKTQLVKPRPVNVEALESYVQGTYHLDRVGRGYGDEENRKAAAYFQQAINTDPNFVQAYIGLADAHDSLLLPSSEDSAIIDGARRKIVELDPDSSTAAVISASARADNWDWVGAESEFRRAVTLNSNNVEAHRELARFLDRLGRLAEGWKEQQIAQQLDPNPDRMARELFLPEALYTRGEYDRAIELLVRVSESQPNDGQTHLLLAQSYQQKGMYREAVEEFGRTAALYGHPEIDTRLRRAFGASDYPAALRCWAQEIEHLQATKQAYMPEYLASIYASLDDKDRAFHWLEESYRLHNSNGLGSDMALLKSDPSFKSMRTDPRYVDLLRRIGLPQ